jgi:hypothetical protein
MATPPVTVFPVGSAELKIVCSARRHPRPPQQVGAPHHLRVRVRHPPTGCNSPPPRKLMIVCSGVSSTVPPSIPVTGIPPGSGAACRTSSARLVILKSPHTVTRLVTSLPACPKTYKDTHQPEPRASHHRLGPDRFLATESLTTFTPTLAPRNKPADATGYPLSSLLSRGRPTPQINQHSINCQDGQCE